VARTQIQFTAEQIERLKDAAAERNVSVSQLVREAVDAQGERSAQAARLQRAVRMSAGKFRSGRPDISRNHDKYLAEDFGD